MSASDRDIAFLHEWRALEAAHTKNPNDWPEHDVHTPEDWEEAVAEGSTRLGYWPWVCAQLDLADDS
jgi:hypothetical protein